TTPGIGASGAVMAVTMLYALHFPYETIRIIWFFPIEMRWLMIFYVIWDLHPVLLALSGDQFYTGVAHAAHLGGLAFGFLYGWYEGRLEPLVDRIPWVGRRWNIGRRPAVRPSVRPRPEPALSDVDEILKKIHESGQDSLTDEERDALRAASERIRSRSKG